jgi:hypothetical protein
MKLAAVLAVAATLGLPAAAARGPQPVLGIDWNDRTGTRLARIDPETLAIQPGRKVLLAGHTAPWAFSPDRTRLVFGGDGVSLRFVDASRMRILGDLRLGLAGVVDYVDWARADRLLVLVRADADDSTVVVVDAARRRVIRTIPIEERSTLGAAAFAGGLVLLLGDTRGHDPAAVAVVDAQGALRTVTIDQISAGYTEYGDGRTEVRRPGLAVDAAAHRAFVVDANFSVAQIDLDSLTVAYHRQTTRSLTKFVVGPARVVRWLGNGMLAVAGADYQGEPVTPTGLRLIDTRTWTWRVVDANVASFEVGRGVLAGTDKPFDGEPRHYSVYGSDGSFRYGVDVPALQSLVVQGAYAYVCRGRGLRRVLDARTGAVLRRYRSSTLPLCATLLYGQSSAGTSGLAPV